MNLANQQVNPVQAFNKQIRDLLRQLECKATTASDRMIIDVARRRLRIVCANDSDETLIDTACPHFMRYAKQIEAGDDAFFLRTSIQLSPDDVDLCECTKRHYQQATAAEKTALISTARRLLGYCAQYMLSLQQ